MLSGCPTYESGYSGTYLEVRDDLSEEVMAIDLFRFGDYANAVVRTYRAPQSEDPDEIFERQTSCAWTALGRAPDEQGDIELTVPGTELLDREALSLKGTFVSETELEIEFRGGQPSGEPPEIETRRFRRSARPPTMTARPSARSCSSPTSATTAPTRCPPPRATPSPTRPSRCCGWACRRARPPGGAVVWVGKRELGVSVRLGEGFLAEGGRGLRESLSLSVRPPSESMLTESGQTRYALAHFVVIDDECDEDDGCADAFDWDVEREPIVATSLQPGIEPGQEEQILQDATGLGKALLFVEGSLAELDEDMRANILHADAYLGTRDEAHFYIVDVFYDDKDVRGLRLPADPARLSRPSYREINMRVTDEYLRATQILLPRLIPFDRF